MPQVSFSYADRALKYTQKKKTLKAFIPSIFAKEGKSLHRLQYVFCSDQFLLDINQRFLQHNDFTDIITFDLSAGTGVTGEIYISVDRVKDNANLFSLSFQDELLRVVFHGALHLCGYKDKKKSEIELIRNRESHYMRLYKQSIPS